jgi:hypothetical protein
MKKNNKIKYLESVCRKHENEIANLESKLRKMQSNLLFLEDAKHRDYIVRTKYTGKIKDENLLKDFKKEISDILDDKFDAICTNILNFQLSGLYKFKDILHIYEMKQIILDTYKK